ncbi:MAG: glycosyltransferase family 4 protein [Candidatus Riflebacteria bacterium]|nr:glycosyltransferase family 4 protein [Candidatus Riflebacteria bacterium]
MKIGVTTFGCDSGKSGIGRYAIELIAEFAQISGKHCFEVLVYETEKDIFVPKGSGIKALTFPESIKNPLINNFWHQIGPPLIAAKRKYDLLFLPAGNRRLVFKSPCATVGTVHDFSSLHVPQKYDQARMFYIKKILPFLIKRLTRVITVSESSKRDIVEYAGVDSEKVAVIHHGVDQKKFCFGNKKASFERISQKFNIKKPFLFYISRIEHPGKNHYKLIRAFEVLKREHKMEHLLVLAGNDWDRAAEVHQAASLSPFKDEIIFTGHISLGDLPDFYRAADVFVFPSLYEGFGMPILEAMACGTPIACSNVSSLPEVAGGAAELFDPFDPKDIAVSINEILNNSRLKEELLRKGVERTRPMTWKRAAEKTLEIFIEATTSFAK